MILLKLSIPILSKVFEIHIKSTLIKNETVSSAASSFVDWYCLSNECTNTKLGVIEVRASLSSVTSNIWNSIFVELN